MANPWRSGRGDSQASGTPEAASWWRALLASHTARSLLAMAVVIAGIAVFAVSIH